MPPDVTRLRIVAVMVASVLVSHAILSAAQPDTGNVSGRVLDSRSGTPLPGAVVGIDGSLWQTVSDRDGRFQLAGIPAGDYVVVAAFLGRPTTRLQLTVRRGETIALEVQLTPLVVIEERVTVSASPIGHGAARALNQQMTAPSIMNVVSADQMGQFPDANAAEAAQRIPGVAIEREKGEGRYVMIRGTEPRLSSILINGERIPSPENDLRQVALDVVPTDLLDAIEVSKALTADMDADAIGGAVNLVTKRAPAQARTLATLAGGYNENQNDWGQGLVSIAAGRRFRGARLGLVGTGSYQDTDRGRDSFEPTYTGGALEELQVRHYVTDRARTGLSGGLDYQFSANDQAFLRATYSELSDRELRRLTSYLVPSGAIERRLSDRVETLTVGNVQIGAHHLFDTGIQLDYRVSAAYAEEREPNRLDTTFAQPDVRFAPNVSPGAIDPDNIQANPLNEDITLFTLEEQLVEHNLATDRDVVGAVDLRFPLAGRRNVAGTLKSGAKYRARRKTGDNNLTAFDPAGEVRLLDTRDPRFDVGTIVDDRYLLGPHVDPKTARMLHARNMSDGTIRQEENLADFDATERTVAAYGMADLAVGARMTLVPGIRVETTRIDYTGFDLRVDEETLTTPGQVRRAREETKVFPGLHWRYAVTPSSNLRVAATRSMARPDYADLVPFQLTLTQDNEIRRGNPDLRSTTSWNYDLMIEHYFDSVGVLSAGVFYKDLTDYIFSFTTRERRGDTLFDVIEPRNSDAASVRGFEVAIQNQLRTLPAPFDGLGLYANYTFTDSATVLPGRESTGQRLPGQASHLGNAAIWYEKGGFSARTSVNVRDTLVFRVGRDPAHDVYLDGHYQIDLSISQVVTDNIRLFVDVLNLTDQPLRFYEGSRDRPTEEQYSSWWASFGIRLNF